MGGMLWRPEISADAYLSPLDLVRDLVTLQIEEIEGLIDQGVRWIQLDSLGYNQVFDEEFRAATGLGGVPPGAILDATVTSDAELVRAVKRKDPTVTVGMHICRGNNRSAWMASGSYEPVAERLFGEVGVDRIKSPRVIRSEIARRQHAAQQHLDASRLQPAHDFGQRLTRHLGVHGAQHVVGAQFEDHRIGAVRHRPIEPRKPAGAGVARHAGIGDFDRKAFGLERPFELDRECVLGRKLIAGRQ